MKDDKSTPSAAIITGGGRGLGRVLSTCLADDFNVLIVGRTEEDLQNTCKEIIDSGNQADYVVGDVANPETAQRVHAKAVELGWNVCALVCNAGVGKSRPLHEISNEEWQSTIDINLNGSFYFGREFLPDMVSQGSGAVCFISSIAGVHGYAYEAPYVASKHAVVGLAKTIALEYGKHGISSVALCPNFVEGEMTERTIHGLAKRRGIPYVEARRIIEKQNPERRIISAEEVAAIVRDICMGKISSLSSPIVMGGEM